MTDIILEIYEIQFGEAFDPQRIHRLREPMSECRLALVHARQPTVSRAAISGWLAKKNRSIPIRPNAISFLCQYLERLGRPSGGIPEGPRLKRLGDLLHRLMRHLPRETPKNPDPIENFPRPMGQRPSFPINPAIGITLRMILEASAARTSHSENDDLFRGGLDDDRDERSYFVMYRFSTLKRQILKSFISIVPPPQAGAHPYTYTHFVWGGDNPKVGNEHVFRECDGLILKLEKSYYFVGYNFQVPINKRASTDLEYETKRRKARKNPDGVGLIAIEYADIKPGLIPGLTMTVAASEQPVVGRVAFLHLGTEKTFGLRVTSKSQIERLVEPRELPFNKLADDLLLMIDRLRDAGCTRLSEHLQAAIRKRDWRETGHKKLAKAIIAEIENRPLWERAKGQKSFRAQGAIERSGPVPRP